METRDLDASQDYLPDDGINRFSLYNQPFLNSNLRNPKYDPNPYVDQKAVEKMKRNPCEKMVQQKQLILTALQDNTLQAAKKNQYTYIEKNRFKYQEGDLDIADQHKNTPIFYAVQNMHYDTLKLLLKLGADVNKKCELGNTPLHQAMMTGDKIQKNVKIMDLLIQSGANPRLKNNFGQTPMFFASKKFMRSHALTRVMAIEINKEDINDPQKL